MRTRKRGNLHSLAIIFLLTHSMLLLEANIGYSLVLREQKLTQSRKNIECTHITFEPGVLMFYEEDDHIVEEVGNTLMPTLTADEVHEIINISREERDLLARMAFCEANSEGVEGMRLVVDVVINRMMSDKFPNTVKEVVYSPGQFSTREAWDHVADHALVNAFKAVDLEITDISKRVDTESLYFARKPLTKNGVYQFGRHYFSK